MPTVTSHGRGGAGNFADDSKSPKLQPEDLKTPTLKTSVVTTGRGGAGNMANNTDAEETRKRQDVDPVERLPATGAQHGGRGGAGNIFKPSDTVPGQAVEEGKEGEHKSGEQHHGGLASKIFGKKN